MVIITPDDRKRVCDLLCRHTFLPPYQAQQYAGLKPGPRVLDDEQLLAIAAAAEVDKQAPALHVRAALATIEAAFEEAEAKAKAEAQASPPPAAGGVDAASDQPAV